MRGAVLAAALVLVLTVALLAEALFDSALGAYVAVGTMFAIALIRLVGLVPGLPFVNDD